MWPIHMIYIYIYVYINTCKHTYTTYINTIYISADPLSMKESSDVCSALLNPSHLSLRPSVCIWHSMPFPPARPPIH